MDYAGRRVLAYAKRTKLPVGEVSDEPRLLPEYINKRRMVKYMKELKLVRPLLEHKPLYEEMMDEWESYGGRINPGAIRRYSNVQQKNVTFERWFQWVKEDRETVQDLFFLMNNERILGAISIRYHCSGIHGHAGYGIRPSERKKGYASKMLAMALPIMRSYGINPAVLSCAKTNIGSAKTIVKNGGRLMEEVMEEETGETIQIYHLYDF